MRATAPNHRLRELATLTALSLSFLFVGAVAFGFLS
jgi:hypothetical protein